MARYLIRRGCMKVEDERCMQINSSYIEHEVDAKHLAVHLFASTVIDGNDRDDILGRHTKLERTRRMIDILLQRGPDAFPIFLEKLDEAGYDHVATRLRGTKEMMTRQNPFADHDAYLQSSDTFIREASAVSLTIQDPGLVKERLSALEATYFSMTGHDPGNLAERLKNTETRFEILSRRMTRIEHRVTQQPTTAISSSREANGGDNSTGQIGEEELNSIKNELSELKKDTITQVEELTSANTQKAAIIENLMEEVEQKTAQLQGAQSRIEELEQRIQRLEEEKAQSKEEVGRLYGELEQHKRLVKSQEERSSAENQEMRNQMQQQKNALTDMQEENDRKYEDLQEQLNQLTNRVHAHTSSSETNNSTNHRQTANRGNYTCHRMRFNPVTSTSQNVGHQNTVTAGNIAGFNNRRTPNRLPPLGYRGGKVSSNNKKTR